jgi:HEAT repeat protein
VSEKARRNLTRAIVGVVIIALIGFALYRRTEIPRLVDTIANGTPAERLEAVQRLIAREKLAEAMLDAPRCVQYNCVAALARIGDHEAMAQMLEAKWDFDEPIEKWCETLLVAWGDTAVGPLVEAIQDKDSHIRAATVVPLSKIGEPAKEPLLELTGAWDQYVRDAVRDVFAKADMAPLVRDELIEILKERQPRPDETPAKHLRRRGTAIAALEKMTTNAFEPLFALLHYEDHDAAFQGELRGQAASSLGNIADQTKDSPIAVADAVRVIEPLIDALSDEDWTVRRRVAEALGPVCKVKAPPADPEQQRQLAAPVDPLIALLSAAQPRDVRGAAAESLGLMGSVRAARPLGVALANDAQRAGAAQEIALALERIGAEAVPALDAALRHRDPDVRELATSTLANIGGPTSTGRLADRLSRDKEDAVRVRRVAANALRNLAEAAYSQAGSPDLQTALGNVLSALAHALADTDWHVYVAARDALARVGRSAVPDLISAMMAGDPRVSYTAAEGLARIGLAAVPQLLVSITERPDSDVAQWAAIALGDIGSPAVPDLVKTLENASLTTAARANAARALGFSRDLKAMEALLAATQDDAPGIRMQAIRSLADLHGVETEEKAGEAAVIAALSDGDAAVRDGAMRVLADWPGVSANEGLVSKLNPPNDENTQRRAAIVFAAQLRAGMLLGMAIESTEEQAKARGRVAGLLQEALGDDAEAPVLRRRALELYGSVATVQRLGKETVRDPASSNIENFISADDIELTHAACKALAAIGARVSREIMREARVGITPEPSDAAKILAKHLAEPELRELVPWYALALAEVRDTAVRTLVEPGDTDDPQPPTGLLIEAPIPTEAELLSATAQSPTLLWAAAVAGRIGKPAVDALFDARGKLGGTKGERIRYMERLRRATGYYDLGEGDVIAAVGEDGVLADDGIDHLKKVTDNETLSPESVRADAEAVWKATRRLRWVHAVMAATRDTLAHDFVENLGEYDLLPAAQYEQLEDTMDELARLRVAEW